MQLRLGEQLEQELAGGETHNYRIDAKVDDVLYLVIDQRGIDVIAELFGPDGEHLVRSDRPINDLGPELLLALAQDTGSYRLEVTSPAGDRRIGKYAAQLVELRPASNIDRQRARAARLFSEADQLRLRGQARDALGRYHGALEIWKNVGDRTREAECMEKIGRVHGLLDEWRTAVTFHERAAKIFQEQGEVRWEAMARSFVGNDYHYLWELDKAIRSFQDALPLRQAAGDLRGEAYTTMNLARAFLDQDEIQQAFDTYSQALELLDSRDSESRALVKHSLGFLYLTLGQPEAALKKFHEAEQAFSALDNASWQAASLSQLGEAYQRLGQTDRSFACHQEALALRERVKDRRGQASSHIRIGQAYQTKGELDLTLEYFNKAYSILNEIRDLALEARLLRYFGHLHLEMKVPGEAINFFRKSADVYRRIGEPTGRAEGLFGVARAQRSRGELGSALVASSEALAIFESVRPKAVRHEHRTSFFATVQQHFEFHIDLLMDLHQQEETAGYSTRALVASEQARARSFLDLLVESNADIRSGADPDLLEREEELQRQLNAWEYRRLKLSRKPDSDNASLAQAESSVDRTHEKLEVLRGELRARHSRYVALTEAPTLDLTSIQREILDPETVLLSYWLGDERGFLWVVSINSSNSYVLPGRGEIERLALIAYQRLTLSRHREARTSARNSLCELARSILPIDIAQLAGERLLIVGDGPLLYIPFAALPAPEDLDDCLLAKPLIVDHEIVHLPSASVLAVLRRETRRLPAPRHTVAVLADPVFNALDRRLSPESVVTVPAQRGVGPSSAGIDLDSFQRLPFSQKEADAIISLVPENERMSLFGFDANKEIVGTGILANYQIVHFATHAILNTEEPDLSGIVLSLLDSEGRPRDGFLRTHEIYNLQLPGELVVLSACQTALGREVRGEGIIGLTRSFMYAGTARVMVSLWNVDDESTSELMRRFYRALLQDQQRPSVALRTAQISMWRDERWHPPFHWAGFVIQGEWR